MSTRHPLAGVDRLLVDGNNLLHRESGGAGEGVLRGLLARLQSAVNTSAQVIVVLDGHSAPGTPSRQRVSAQLEVRHAGSRSADDLIVQLTTAEAPPARARTVVVTDDRALTERSRSAGARTQRLAWLQGLLARSTRPAPGPATSSRPEVTGGDEAPSEDDRGDRWRPGRGATRKRGNPRKRPRRSAP